MRGRSRNDPRYPRIAIVGGGVASLVAGITLREKVPDARITIYCATDEALAGGQLASWDEQGYPVEHGLHALFGFYDHILPLLRKIGAYENLTRSKEHIFVRERGGLHRFDLHTWPATYGGFTLAQKMRSLAAAPAIAKLVFDIRRKGLELLDEYDRFDLRALARKHGIPESVLSSGFVRQFYEAAFNAPSELSATVALQSIYKIFSRKWHYYFNLPTRESIVAPLQRYFEETCRGTMQFNQKLVCVRVDEAHERVAGLEFENPATKEHWSLNADEYVLALGLEDFKQVDFGPVASQYVYFQNIRKLQTVSSFSIQAWFKDDPVPPGIDSIISGMPPPFGILCPITRVRATPPPVELPLRHELIATGPERGYEDIPDEAIKAGFITGLRDSGFRLPEAPADMHIVLRRNHQPFHRYLLTRPGQLQWRPPHQSPLMNLCLAGAWVRNAFALPCVDAAAEGAIKVAGLIAARSSDPQRTAELRRFVGMPRAAPLVLPPPYRFPRSTGSFFLLDANAAVLAAAISPDLTLMPGLGGKLLFAALRHEDVYAQSDPTGARYSYHEVMLAAFVRENRSRSIDGVGLYPLSLYVDDDTAMAAGREIYGFPKKMARIEADVRGIDVVRCGLAPSVAPGRVQPIKLISARWSGGMTPLDPQGSLSGSRPATRFSLIRPPLARLARRIAFYNTRDIAQVDAGPGAAHGLCELTKVALPDVEVHRVRALHGLCLQVEASVSDPVYLLTNSSAGPSIRAAWGTAVDFSFSMGGGTLVKSMPSASEQAAVRRYG